MFKRFEKDGRLLGFVLEQKNRFYFFGTRHVERDDLPRLFPNFEFCFLKQVHGRKVVSADPASTLEADAHFTSVPGLALIAQSADCMPLLLSAKNQVCAIHAGWRGIAANIIQAASEHVPGVEVAAIGPHIARESFEIGADVCELLLKSAPKAFSIGSPGTEKVHFDLKALAKAQLRASFDPETTIIECNEDTKANPLFHSYRREGKQALRQYSFVVII